jgi:hypothetical protein
MKVCLDYVRVVRDSNLLSSQVTVPFNFRRAASFRPQNLPSEVMIWEDNTPRKLLSEDGYIMVATMPKLMGYHNNVNYFYFQYPTKKINKNYRLKSQKTFSNILNMSNLTRASPLPVRTKPGNIWIGLENCVEKFDL